MPEVTRRRTGELLRKLFEILEEYPEGRQAGNAMQALKSAVQLTEYEAGFYESGGQRFEKIVRFSTVDCVKAGWLIKNKGRWSITGEGKKAYAAFTDPETFYQQAVKLYNRWKATQRATTSKPQEQEETQTPEKDVSITFEKAEEQAWAEIEQYLRGIDPYDFQDLVASLLKAMEYHISWVSPPGKDGGIDILAWGDPLGTHPPRIKVQVKRVTSNIGVEGLRSFLALLGDDEVGLFVTTGGFTKDAEDEARSQSRRKITLVDLKRLFDLWIEYYSRLDDTARRRLPLQPIYFLAPLT